MRVLLLLVFAALSQGAVIITLDRPTIIGQAGQTLGFTGKLENTSNDSVLLWGPWQQFWDTPSPTNRGADLYHGLASHWFDPHSTTYLTLFHFTLDPGLPDFVADGRLELTFLHSGVGEVRDHVTLRFTTGIAPVPEPSSFLLMLPALGLVLRARKRT